MKCKHCQSEDMNRDGMLVNGDDRNDEDFAEFLDLELWTCRKCHFTFTNKKET